MTPEEASARLELDYLVRQTSELARVPTAVPLGFETLMEANDPLLVHYVQDVVRPRIDALGIRELIDVGNNLVVRVGDPGADRALVIQNYTVTQHHNHMAEPFSGKMALAAEFGCDEPCVFGQGVSQNKAHQATMLCVLKLLAEARAALGGCLYWVVNNEGRSTHDCTRAVLARLGRKPDFGIVQLGTGLKVWLGNRGRVDIDVHIRGKAAHSSTPERGLSAIDGANEVMNRLKRLAWTDRHPLLGGRQAIVYKVKYEPVAPHTLPEHAYLTVDRRLLPGDDPAAAVAEIAAAIGDMRPFEVRVTQGVVHLPALAGADEPWVRAFLEAGRSIAPAGLDTVHVGSAFDAGGLTAAGIPAVTFGAGAGIYPLGPDFVPISQLEREARLLAQFILERLG